MHKAVRVDHVGASVGEGNRRYVQCGCVVSKHLRCRIFGGRVSHRDRGALPARTPCYVSGPCLPTSAQVRSHAHGSVTAYLPCVRTYVPLCDGRTYTSHTEKCALWRKRYWLRTVLSTPDLKRIVCVQCHGFAGHGISVSDFLDSGRFGFCASRAHGGPHTKVENTPWEHTLGRQGCQGLRKTIANPTHQLGTHLGNTEMPKACKVIPAGLRYKLTTHPGNTTARGRDYMRTCLGSMRYVHSQPHGRRPRKQPLNLRAPQDMRITYVRI